MMRTMIIHNLLSSVKSFRFLLSGLIVVCLFALSGILFNSRLTLAAGDYRAAELKNSGVLETTSEHLSSVAVTGQELYCPPGRLQFISAGSDERLPNRLTANAFSSSALENISRFNPLCPDYGVFDWAFIIGFVMSFVALTLTYDAITMEKESGTLRSVLSNPAGRREFLTAKFISAVLVILLPLTVGILLNLIILSTGHPEILTLAGVVRIVCVYAVSVIYLSVFVLGGLVFSSVTERSATSLVLCLICWIFLVLIIPNLGGLIAQTFFPISPARDIDTKISLATQDIYKKAPGEVWSCFTSDLHAPCYRMIAEMNRSLLASTQAIRASYYTEQLRQVETGRTWIKISPEAIYGDLLSRITNTGVDRVLDFQTRVARYRDALLNFVRSEDAKDTSSPHLVNPYDSELYSAKPVDPRAIPRFGYTEPRATDLLRQSLADILMMFMQGLVLFGLGLAAFERFDIR